MSLLPPLLRFQVFLSYAVCQDSPTQILFTLFSVPQPFNIYFVYILYLNPEYTGVLPPPTPRLITVSLTTLERSLQTECTPYEFHKLGDSWVSP